MKTSTLQIPPPPPTAAVLAWTGNGWIWVRVSRTGTVLTAQASGSPQFRVPGAGGPHATTHKAGGSDEIKLHELGDPTAAVDFAQQQATQLRIENRTSDPASPAEGEIWLRTDL